MSKTAQAQENGQNSGPMPDMPDSTISAREMFGVDIDMQVPAFSQPNQYVPDFDADYLFDKNELWRCWPVLPITGVSWCRAITALANPPILSKWLHG